MCRLDGDRPNIGPLSWNLGRSQLGNGADIFRQFRDRLDRRAGLDRKTRSLRQEQVRRFQSFQDHKGKGCLASDTNGNRQFLGLDEILAEGLREHGQNAVVGHEDRVLVEKLTTLLVLGVILAQGIEGEHFLDKLEVVNGIDHLLDPFLGFVLDNETDFGLFEGVGLIVAKVMDRMRDGDALWLAGGFEGSHFEAKLNEDGRVGPQELVVLLLFVVLVVVLQESCDCFEDQLLIESITVVFLGLLGGLGCR